MRRLTFVLILVFFTGSALASDTALRVAVGEYVEDIACVNDPSQTYTLYLPNGFTNERRWPVLLIFDPRGRSVIAADVFREAADEYGWILVSSDNTRSDGPMEPNIIALEALWPEIHIRLPVDRDRIYAAGFSGGAHVAYLLGKTNRELAGVIACGGRLIRHYLEDTGFAVFASGGTGDYNHREMRMVESFVAELGNPHRFQEFVGTHSWFPPAVGREAVQWMELLAMQRGTREVDGGLVERLLAVELEAAEILASDGRSLYAGRRLRSVESSYEGLVEADEIAEIGRRAATLESSPEARAQEKDEQRWDKFEAKYLKELDRELAVLRFSEIPPPVAKLVRSFRIAELQLRAEEPGVEGLTAQRGLNSLNSAVSFYLPRDFQEEGRYAHLAASLEVALRIREDNLRAWYNLACVRALLGRTDEAVEALEEAIVRGFQNRELLEIDNDLDSLREREDFKALIARVIED